ncbi:ubiquitin-like protein 7 [Phlebotomus argentipes]|uniref:ubiquitin-like protein 7 n=1 Tax=Phlebotomus argentipes TaxID=94469 RepID=UPI0028936D12|nr:ubiquitin-like protein 7 [Phlebotomus argentipes]
MVSVYVGLRFPVETYASYERFAVNDVILSLNCDSLKIAVAKKVKIPTKDIELIYCGRPICDGLSLESQGVKPGVTIHAMQKAPQKSPPKRPTITPEQKQKIVTQFQTLLSSHFQRISRPEVLQEVLDQFPGFYSNLGALAFLRDPILLSSMQDPENLEKILENYSILVEAAPMIAKVLKGAEKAKSDTPQEAYAGDDQLSDSSSGSDSILPSPATSYENRNTPRRITRQQLGAALALATEYTSRNSLSNIAQRNLDENAESGEQNPTPGPSTSSRAAPISTSMLNDVLSRIGTAPGSQQASSESPATGQAVPPAQQFAAELQRMREMGFLDDRVNLQALQVCNGDVEAAINLVFSDEL